jgi:tetraacyldisaccharide 4'-kinase
VVSVGNLTLGGTGKTPMVQWVARWFRKQGVRVTIISRGYGAEEGARNDEAIELEQNLPDVPHLQHPDRVEAAGLAIEQFDTQLIVLDDAFQHRRIARDLDIVLLDATEPFGFGHVFPRGMLREPISGVGRAHVIVLTRSDMVEPVRRTEIRRKIESHAPRAIWAEAIHSPRAFIDAGGVEEPIRSLKGKPVAAFCGIGNPTGFVHTLAVCRCQVESFREFPDHHRYSREDVESLCQWADSLDVAAIVCTHKDLVKLRIHRLGRHPLRAVSIGLKFLSGQTEVETRLEAIIPEKGATDAQRGESLV